MSITGDYRNIRTMPVVTAAPVHEDTLELTKKEGSETSSPSISIDASPPSRAESNNNIDMQEAIFSEFMEKEEESRAKCLKVFTRKLVDSLYPTTISYRNLQDAYKTDKVARQKFYQAARKSGAVELYLGSRLDPRYQMKDFVITIEQDTGRFFLDSPFGRRSIKRPKNLTNIFDTCCITREETLRATLRIAFQVAKSIFTPHRVGKTDPFIRFEDYICKKWHHVNIDPLDERDERLGVHYSPIKNISGYMNPLRFTSFQIQDIAKELRYRQRS